MFCADAIAIPANSAAAVPISSLLLIGTVPSAIFPVAPRASAEGNNHETAAQFRATRIARRFPAGIGLSRDRRPHGPGSGRRTECCRRGERCPRSAFGREASPMSYRAYSAPRGSETVSPLEKERLLYKEFETLDGALAWARHVHGRGQVTVLIEGDDGTRLDRTQVATALHHGEYAEFGRSG